MCPCNAHLISEEKGDMPIQRVFRIYGTRISLFMDKKVYQQMLHVPTRSMPVGTHMCTYVANGHRLAQHKMHCVEHKVFNIFEALTPSWV
jgi:hypothetical protein